MTTSKGKADKVHSVKSTQSTAQQVSALVGGISSRRKLKIGVLDLMTMKAQTLAEFKAAFLKTGRPVDLIPLYPATHHFKHPRDPWRQVATPLDQVDLEALDALVITGAPLDQLEFESIDFWDELCALFDRVEQLALPLLTMCWGAMAAVYYYYGVEKAPLPVKLFGTFAHRILEPANPLMAGLNQGFIAPHARYQEVLGADLATVNGVKILATTLEGHLCAASDAGKKRTFLFSHLEYGPTSLDCEYQRECAAHPEKSYLLPIQAGAGWAKVTRQFFTNWLQTDVAPVPDVDADKTTA